MDQTPPSESKPLNSLLRRILAAGVVSADAWESLSVEDRDRIAADSEPNILADQLTAFRLVTTYQAAKVRSGSINGLVLGNYRILEKIGSGGMGVVFRAEHVKLRTPAAVKALFVDGVKNRRSIERFFLEVRAVATLKHPNIVAAMDAGEEQGAGPHGEPVPYFVMEYLAGRDLDELITQDGPLPIPQACQYVHQIADALTEAHRQGLVHRDIKPSNILIQADGTAKLLDFGVARLPSNDHRLTQDGARLGTIGYMAPEQARNPREVDVRADVFGLAATLFYALTGHDPFLQPGGALLATKPPSVRDFRADVPAGLDELLAHMMALDPARRVASAADAMRMLADFLGFRKAGQTQPADKPLRGAQTSEKAAKTQRILIVDDEEPVRRICRLALQQEAVTLEEAANGADAVELGTTIPYDLILLDIDLPGLNGELAMRQIRKRLPSPHLKIMMFSGRTTGDDLSRMLNTGADDFLTKPFSVVQLRARVKSLLRLKEAQDRSDSLGAQLASSNGDLERLIGAKDGELLHARGALVLAMAKLVEQRSTETGPHLIRLQRYCRVLAEHASRLPAFHGRLEPDFVQLVEAAAPLHDIGKVGVPDYVLNKPGLLTPDEKQLMQTHTVNAAETLAEVSARYAFATGFFHTAIEIARSHHERWDGSGYPDRLSGEAIPLSARLVAVGDVYDALRSRRVYKPAFNHAAALEQILERSEGHFDPNLIEAFRIAAPQFDRIFQDSKD